MPVNTSKVLVCMMAAALLFPMSDGVAFTGPLNPEGINPHAEAPKKKISLERKIAAAEARKKMQAEIAARKAGQPSPPASAVQGTAPAGSANDLTESGK